MAPEIYRNEDAFDGEAIDVWAAGVVLFCMVTGNGSYRIPVRADATFYWMTHNLRQLLVEDWGFTDLSPECIDLMENMLRIDPRLRLTLDEILDHVWLSSTNENKQTNK